MYKAPYNYLANKKFQDEINEINKKIKEEKEKPDANQHKIMRLEEQKYMQDLFAR